MMKFGFSSHLQRTNSLDIHIQECQVVTMFGRLTKQVICMGIGKQHFKTEVNIDILRENTVKKRQRTF